jgi:hypothetical protein
MLRTACLLLKTWKIYGQTTVNSSAVILHVYGFDQGDQIGRIFANFILVCFEFIELQNITEQVQSLELLFPRK